MPTEVALPTGLRGMIRELGIEEENILSDPKLARSGKNLQRVLENCWLETIEPGIYDFGGDDNKPFDVLQLLQGDSLALLIKLRIESYGPEFLFDANCPQCGSKIPWELDLNEFLEKQTKPLPEASKEILLNNGGVFETVLPKSRKNVKFRLFTVRDELRFPDIRRKSYDRMSSALLDIATTEIEGVRWKRAFLGLEPHAKADPEKLTISSADATHLRNEMEEVNCGVYTVFEIECVEHGEVSVELPFRENFLVPKRRRR